MPAHLAHGRAARRRLGAGRGDRARDPAGRDLVDGHPLHEATWELLLDRAGFVGVPRCPAATEQDRRIALAAAAPS